MSEAKLAEARIAALRRWRHLRDALQSLEDAGCKGSTTYMQTAKLAREAMSNFETLDAQFLPDPFEEKRR